MRTARVEQNKQIVRDYFARNNAGDYPACLAMLAEDGFELECRARPPVGYVVDKERLARMMQDVDGRLLEPLQINVDTLTAEDDRVAARASSRARLLRGGEYKNNYHFLFTIRDGWIVRIEEYLCSFTMVRQLDDAIWQDAVQPII